jgi:hypothetical protein
MRKKTQEKADFPRFRAFHRDPGFRRRAPSGFVLYMRNPGAKSIKFAVAPLERPP